MYCIVEGRHQKGSLFILPGEWLQSGKKNVGMVSTSMIFHQKLFMLLVESASTSKYVTWDSLSTSHPRMGWVQMEILGLGYCFNMEFQPIDQHLYGP